MTVLYCIGGGLTAALAVYLLYALIRPEEF